MTALLLVFSNDGGNQALLSLMQCLLVAQNVRTSCPKAKDNPLEWTQVQEQHLESSPGSELVDLLAFRAVHQSLDLRWRIVLPPGDQPTSLLSLLLLSITLFSAKPHAPLSPPHLCLA